MTERECRPLRENQGEKGSFAKVRGAVPRLKNVKNTARKIPKPAAAVAVLKTDKGRSVHPENLNKDGRFLPAKKDKNLRFKEK